jgi:extradiol dioxygenase family protein
VTSDVNSPSARSLPATASALSLFHLAIPVRDLAEARHFYGELFGCAEGRSAPQWVDFDFFGHQLVAHLDPARQASRHFNAVDGHDVPVPHFGVVLPWEAWHELAEGLRAAGVRFQIEPGIRFAGKVGEQATFFLYDPSGNALEFKAFRDPSQLFAK